MEIIGKGSEVDCEAHWLQELRPALERTLWDLDVPPSMHCVRCQAALGQITVVTADVDQAFEACSPSL
eukprot:10828512-Heterocapsa_arctica.AAC.1